MIKKILNVNNYIHSFQAQYCTPSNQLIQFILLGMSPIFWKGIFHPHQAGNCDIFYRQVLKSFMRSDIRLTDVKS